MTDLVKDTENEQAALLLLLLLLGLAGLAWLSWRAGKMSTLSKDTGKALEQSRQTLTLTQQADNAAANACPTNNALEEALNHGTF